MGLAPYGRPRYVDLIRDRLLDLREDGSFRLNLDYFGYLDGLTMTNHRFAELFGGPPRPPESDLTQREMDLAASIQVLTEEIVLRMARHARRVTGEKNLCWPAAWRSIAWPTDACSARDPSRTCGSSRRPAMPAAPWGARCSPGTGSRINPGRPTTGDRMNGARLGPAFPADDIDDFLRTKGYPATRLAEADWAPALARLVADGNVIGLCEGRMEFGPRALGGRSIIGDARSAKMQSIMNLKIKYRESFRPFAPSCLEERAASISSSTGPRPICCWWRRSAGTAARHRPRQAPVRSRAHQPGPLRHPRRHPRGLFRPGADRQPRDQPRYYDLIKAFDGADRLRGHHQHLVQRPRGADRLHARGRLPLLHADRDGLSRARRFPAGQEDPAALPRPRQLAQGFRVGLTRFGARRTMRTLKYLVRMLRDFGQFAWQNKAWWIVPVVIILLLLSALIFVGTSVAPFLYPMV
jgi:hypothetical protein